MYPSRWTALRYFISFLLLVVEINGRLATVDDDRENVSLEDEAEVEEGPEDDDVPSRKQGNGFELAGLRGHHGMFRVFNWTRDELIKISEYHATNEYYKVVEMVQEKLATTNLHPLVKNPIIAFINRNKPPEHMKHLYTAEQKIKIKELHRNREMTKLLAFYQRRFSTLRPEIKQQIFDYMNISNRT